jgi:hypothetical protein
VPPGEYSARADGRDVAADFAGTSDGDRSGNAVDVQAEGVGTKGNDHSGGCSADGGDESESVSALVDERALKDLPLNGRRFTHLLLVVPGVKQDPRG